MILKDMPLHDDIYSVISAEIIEAVKSQTSAFSADIKRNHDEIQFLSAEIDRHHPEVYEVNGTKYGTLAEAINAANEAGGTLKILSDITVSKTDSGQLPAITKCIDIDGNNKTLTIDSKVTTENGAVFELQNSDGGSARMLMGASEGCPECITFRNLNIKSTDCTAVLANDRSVRIENSSIKGASTASLVKMQDGAECTMLSVQAANDSGSIIEADTEAKSASFLMKGCDFNGAADKAITILRNSDTTPNTFTFNGGNYVNCRFPELNDNTKVVATYTGATEEITDASLSAGLSSSFTFDENVPEDFKTKIVDQLLNQKPMKWYVRQSEDGKTYIIDYKAPVRIPALSALLQLRQDVLDGNCHEDDRFVQVDDIDMEDLVSPKYIDVAPHGIYWDGIGLKGAGGWGVDTAHTFKGMYDGNGKVVKNLRFAANLSAKEDRFSGLFRSVCGAYIKDLSVYVGGDISGGILANYRDSDNEPCDPGVTCITCNGFDPKLVASGYPYGGAAIVGIALSGCTIENCASFGSVGTLEHPTTHTTAGIMCFNAEGGTSGRLSSEYVLTKVTNNANVFSTRKAGGICAYPMCVHRYTDVTNNGTIMKTVSSKEYQDDAVGGIFGYADNNQAASVPSYQFTNVKNTGVISADELLLKSSSWLGQYAGKSMAYHNGYTPETHFFDNWMSGDMICRADTEAFAGNFGGLRMHLYDLDLWYGEFLADDPTMVKLTKPVAGGLYKVMVDKNSALSVTITQPNSWGGTDINEYPPISAAARIKLNRGEAIYLDESLVSEDLRGHANVFCSDTAVEGKLSVDAVYCYQA